MDDLSGLSWSSNTTSNKPPPMSTGSYYSSLRPTPPISGRSTPLSAQPSGGRPKLSTTAPSKSSTPANDSFSNLVSFTSSTSTKNLSLQEQQKRLEEQKVELETERKKLFNAHFGTQHSQSGHTLGNGSATPGQVTSPYPGTEGHGVQKLSNVINKPFAGIGNVGLTLSAKPADDEDDILAAFNSTAPVDASSNFPVPLNSSDGRTTPNAIQAVPMLKPPVSDLHDLMVDKRYGGHLAEDEDDPFGLGHMNVTRPSLASSQANGTDEDDVLGLLGKPISELPLRISVERSTMSFDDHGVVPPTADAYPQDQAIAELVDMGFSAAKARQALANTESGVDIQAAVGLLLSQAHEESRQNSRGKHSPNGLRRQSSGRSGGPNGDRPERKENPRGDAAMPAWLQQGGRSTSVQRRQDSKSPVNAEKDAARYVVEIGNNLFRSANSLWKTGTKKMQQAVAELNSDSDSNQPKWMRTTHPDGEAHRPKVRRPSKSGGEEGRRRSFSHDAAPHQRLQNGVQHDRITDEALMLESGNSRPQPKTSRRPRETNSRLATSSMSSRDQSPALNDGSIDRFTSQPKFSKNQQIYDDGPKARLSRQVVEEQSSTAYVSPARRKRPQPKPAESEPDLLFDSRAVPQPPRPSTTAPTLQQSSTTRSQPSENPSTPATPIATRPKVPLRKIPPVSASALSSSASYRRQGTDSFKLGDYAAAHSAYTSALSSLPDQHPVTIIILCNRALTALKTGEPKAAISDADSALSLIGPSRGEGETITLAQNEGQKDMREFYGKALMRKAEALEQTERWEEAAKVWREAVEAGHGGSTSIKGRDRSEKAAGRGSSQTSAPVTRRPPPAQKAPAPKSHSALDDLSGRSATSTAPSAEAVTRLRAANAAAEKADDEKFALADSVDAKLFAWKNGKQDNLRALLGSLDTVLWPEAGWKKVGLHELVLANKVKVVYMKGIAKVHPDKLPPTATTEQRMISGAVFSALNEAWDKFKKENAL
ncbi:MAG: hypothetical protein M1830_010159 [Pleopsidium flavum]|nr:MAG: hypothetical protein M1830_010159 [Pleopsidium flavum]